MVLSEAIPLFCNENPNMVLYREDAAEPSAAVSFWRSFFSPVGAGAVLALRRRAGSEAPAVELYADNPDLGRVIAGTFVRHWPPFRRTQFAAVAPRPAWIAVETDGRRFYRVTCIAATDVVVEWRGFGGTVRHARHVPPGVVHQGEQLAVENVVVPAGRIRLAIDGEEVAGDLRADGDPFTFVTLCETWSPVDDHCPAASGHAPAPRQAA
jgi:hypothetical protein